MMMCGETLGQQCVQRLQFILVALFVVRIVAFAAPEALETGGEQHSEQFAAVSWEMSPMGRLSRTTDHCRMGRNRMRQRIRVTLAKGLVHEGFESVAIQLFCQPFFAFNPLSSGAMLYVHPQLS
jgi:hypothetical protein